MAKVTIQNQNDLEKAIRSFKMRCKKEGILQSVRDKQHYTKPSVQKRQDAIKSKRKMRNKAKEA
ncbi:MAG: 30S ribosomal protein S21 [PVC group bacterium]|nr:30S ribosomal protein S21 [PVC group bacterium]